MLNQGQKERACERVTIVFVQQVQKEFTHIYLLCTEEQNTPMFQLCFLQCAI